MNKLEFDREKLIELWKNSYNITQQLKPFIQKPNEYYYHSGVIDACRVLFGEKLLKKENTDADK